jgi:hypothetical protein
MKHRLALKENIKDLIRLDVSLYDDSIGGK